MNPKRVASVLALSLCVLNLQACSDTTLLRYSQNLSDTAKGSGDKAQTFYDGLQDAHSQMHIDELKLQPEAATPLDPAVPGPNCPFTKSDVANRVQAARFVETYSIKLNELAHSKNPDEMQAAITDANSQLKGFSITGFNPLATLRSASTPITTSLKIIGRRGFAVWSDRWIKLALSQSNISFIDQSNLLKLELNADAESATTRASALQGLAERVYRKKITAHASNEDTKASLDEVQRLSNFRQSVAKDNPSRTYDDLLEIHKNLMTRVPEDFKK
jgi:hypothetical protein